MGTYLVTGIVQEIVVYKEMIKEPKLSFQKIAEQLKLELNLDHYDSYENQDGYYWKIKPTMLNQNLANFLAAQFNMYTNKQDHHMQMVIEQPTNINSEQVLELAASKNLLYCQLIENIIEPIKVLRDNGCYDYVETNYSIIAYFIDGKIIMESYKDVLRYFENNLRLQRDNYPIVDCVKIMLKF